MKLFMDIGNSRIKWGLRDGNQWNRTGEADEAGQLAGLALDAQDAVAACVAGTAAAAEVTRFCETDLGVPVRFLETPHRGGGVHVAYSDPASLGVDRWLAMVGAKAEVPGDLCVVDAGTAVTLDLLRADGQHLGGYIIPGMGLMAGSLEQSTADLKRLSRATATPGAPDMAPGLNTADAISHGALLAVAGAVALARAQLEALTGTTASVVITGGNAEILHAHIPPPSFMQPLLVLEGMAGLESC